MCTGLEYLRTTSLIHYIVGRTLRDICRRRPAWRTTTAIYCWRSWIRSTTTTGKRREWKKPSTTPKAIRLATISNLLEKQKTQTNKIVQIVQPLQKRLNSVETRTELIKQIHSQLKQLQKEMSRVQKENQKIRSLLGKKTFATKKITSTKKKSTKTKK